MILKFEVENFLSIKDKVTLSLIPQKNSKNQDYLQTNINSIDSFQALNTVVLYGANASGKSNILKALVTAINIIKNSKNYNIDDKLPVTPFLFDELSKEKASTFEFTFIAKDNHKYFYGFSSTKDKIEKEYLYKFVEGKKVLIFSITSNKYARFNPEFKEKLKKSFEFHIAQKLFISTATMFNNECTQTPFEWFTSKILSFSDIYEIRKYVLNKYQNKDYVEECKNFVIDFLKSADINISNFSLDYNFNEINIKTFHIIKTLDGSNKEYDLDFSSESVGTKILFFYAPILKEILNDGKLFILDELDKSLHSKLLMFLINRFRETNDHGAQLISALHDTTILNKTILRPEQIYFVQKDNNTGISQLYSLSEFELEDSEDYSNNYLLGTYGAVPFVI